MKKILLTVSLILASKSVFAFGWPVFDISTMIQMIKVYETNMQILHSAEQQVQNTKDELVSMTQPTDWSSLYDSPQDLENSLYTAQSWQDALEGKSNGSNPTYTSSIETFVKDHPIVTPKLYEQFHTPTQYQHFNQLQETVKAVSATSQTEYANTDKYVTQIQKIGEQASSSKNTGLKTAIDLNTRMLQQIGYLIAAQIRLQSVSNNLNANKSSQAIDSQNFKNQFYTKKDS